MDVKTTIPGLTFHVDSAHYKDSAAFKAKGTVQLTVDIDDLETWEEVIRRLDGMRVYAVDDFHRQLMTSLQQENEDLAQSVAKQAEENRVLRDRIEHLGATTEQQIAQLKQTIGHQTLELQRYRNTVEETQAVLDLLVPPTR